MVVRKPTRQADDPSSIMHRNAATGPFSSPQLSTHCRVQEPTFENLSNAEIYAFDIGRQWFTSNNQLKRPL